eukprot:jgi/Hompol1/4817/HPOL_003924-RA
MLETVATARLNQSAFDAGIAEGNGVSGLEDHSQFTRDNMARLSTGSKAGSIPSAGGSNLASSLLPIGVPPASQGVSMASSGFSGSLAPGTLSSGPPPGVLPTASQIAPSERFGLNGLLDVIRMTSEDVSMLALGCDLTSLGLNLNSPDPIYSTFMTPFSSDPAHLAEPQFTLPSCYLAKNLSSAPSAIMSKLTILSDETLFYIFYTFTCDVLQEASAQELYNRLWRYHKELRLWLCKDITNGEPFAKGNGYERGIYIFFDPSTWSKVKKEWTLFYHHLEERASSNSSANGSLPNGSRSVGAPGVIGSGSSML